MLTRIKLKLNVAFKKQRRRQQQQPVNHKCAVRSKKREKRIWQPNESSDDMMRILLPLFLVVLVVVVDDFYGSQRHQRVRIQQIQLIASATRALVEKDLAFCVSVTIVVVVVDSLSNVRMYASV